LCPPARLQLRARILIRPSLACVLAAGLAARMMLLFRTHGGPKMALEAKRTPDERFADLPGFEPAGARQKIYFDPAKTRVGIVTCGGLCPGLNNVIRGLVMELWFHYGVRKISGFTGGFRGFIPDHGHSVIDLTPEVVSNIHDDGGTILGTSRGRQETDQIVDCLERMGISILFVIGGDGSLRGAMKIAEIVGERNEKISVVGIPKTIDNDIP